MSDTAAFRPSNGTWYGACGTTGGGFTVPHGHHEDVPVPGDYDRDGFADVAAWRPSDNHRRAADQLDRVVRRRADKPV